MIRELTATNGNGLIPVAELDRIAEARLKDGQALLAGGRYDGAAYVCGYAVEVGLKARICRTLNWSDFPSTSGEFQAFRTFQTHELDVLLRLSGQEARIKQQHFSLWNAVAVWKVESRYNVIGTIQGADAESMISAAEHLIEGSMTTTELPTRFVKLESDVSAARGDFALFALFLREDLPDRWDLMISAPWAVADRKGALDYLITRIKSDLGPADLTQLSRIVFIDPKDIALQNLNRAIHVEHGAVEVRDSDFFGLPIKHAFIITSKMLSPAVTG